MRTIGNRERSDDSAADFLRECWVLWPTLPASVPSQSSLWHRSVGHTGCPSRSSAGAARSPSAVSPDPAALS